MTEKLTLKKLSGELEALRSQIQGLELQFERKLEITLEKAAAALKTRIESHDTLAHAAGIDAEQRQHMIAEEAYLIAERRGFEGGDPALDWAEAETTVNNRLMQAGSPEKPLTRRKKPAARKPAAKRSAAKTSAT